MVENQTNMCPTFRLLLEGKLLLIYWKYTLFKTSTVLIGSFLKNGLLSLTNKLTGYWTLAFMFNADTKDGEGVENVQTGNIIFVWLGVVGYLWPKMN